MYTNYNIFQNSRMELNEVYFWTDTINDRKKLLIKQQYKEIIIEQLQWLKSRNKIEIYAFVIMPNHLHFIWEMKEMNGKEKPYASFNKWTSSNFLKDIRKNHPEILPFFEEKTLERNHRFWIKDPQASLINDKKILEQKIEYIHNNPIANIWKLAENPIEYKWSSAKFYKTGNDEFNILTHYENRF
jgi:putative transposase